MSAQGGEAHLRAGKRVVDAFPRVLRGTRRDLAPMLLVLAFVATMAAVLLLGGRSGAWSSLRCEAAGLASASAPDGWTGEGPLLRRACRWSRRERRERSGVLPPVDGPALLRGVRAVFVDERGALTIPNEAAAFNPNQAEPDKVDIDILVASFNRTFVAQGVSGECAVTFNSGMQFAIAGGDVYSNGRRWAVGATTKTLSNGDATNPRFDLITVDIAGVVVVRVGAASASPVFPFLPFGDVALAAIYVPAGETTSAANRITDKRIVKRDRLLSYFPASAYGAVGDGVADDTAAIQAALDAANTAGGGVVYLEEGVFILTDVLTIYSGTYLVGTGWATVLRQTVATKDCIKTPSPTSAPYPSGWQIKNLRLQADPPSGKCGAAIRVSNSRQWFIENIWIEGTDVEADRWQYGIIIDDTDLAAGRQCSRHGAVRGFWITSISADAGSTGIKVRVRVDGTSNGWGFFFSDGIVQTQYHPYTDTFFTSNGDIGVWINGTDGTHFHNVEVISFKTVTLFDSAGGLTAFGITNTKFTQVSMESPTANNQPALHLRGIVGSLDFWGCTAYGTTSLTGTVGVLADGDAGGAVRAKFTNMLIIGGASTGSAGVRMNNANAVTTMELRFNDCELSDGIDGIEMNENARVVHWRGGRMTGCENFLQVNGTSTPDSVILAEAHLIATGNFKKYLDWTSTGRRTNLVMRGNTPTAANRGTFVFEDHFIGGSFSTAGSIGLLGWNGSGSTPVPAAFGELGHPGVYQKRSSSDGVFASIYLAPMGLANGPIDCDDDFDLTYVAKWPEVASGRYGLFCGLTDGESLTPSNAIMFRSEDATLGLAQSLRAVTRTGGVETSTSVLAAFTADWYTLRMVKFGASVRFFVNGELKATHTTNIPTAQACPIFSVQRKDATGGDRNVLCDYFRAELMNIAA